MKNTILSLVFLISLFSFAACDPENVIDTPTEIYTDTLDYSWDSTKVVKVTFEGESINVSSDNVLVDGTTMTINSKGTYELSGTLTNGQVKVNAAEGIVRILLNNVNITNSKTSPIFIEQAHKTIMILPDGTNSTISDGSQYEITPDSLNAAIYSKDYLAFFGTGKLTVNGNYDYGISAHDELIIQSGNLTVNSVGVGIRGKDYLKIYDGNIVVNSQGDALRSDNDSLPLGYIDIESGTFTLTTPKDGITAKNYINIIGGNYTITTGGGSTIKPDTISRKGIKARTNIEISGGTFNISSSDDCIKADTLAEINGGTFNLSTGNKAFVADSSLTINYGNMTITKAVKGISSHHITVNGGTVKVTSTNDCLKATKSSDLKIDDGSSIDITGGSIFLTTAKGDAVDSNGKLNISGGTIVTQGSSTSPDDLLSYRNKCVVSGGKIFAMGATSMVPNVDSTQITVRLNFYMYIPAGTLINIQDANGNSIVTFKNTKYAYSFLLSSPLLKTGVTYTVYTGGSVSGTDTNGYYEDGVYTVGTLKGTFTLSSVNSTVYL